MFWFVSSALGCLPRPTVPEFVSGSPASLSVPSDEVIWLDYYDVGGQPLAVLHSSGDEVELPVTMRTAERRVIFEIDLQHAVEGDWVEIDESTLLGYYGEPVVSLYGGPSPARFEVLAPSGAREVLPVFGAAVSVSSEDLTRCELDYRVEVLVDLPEISGRTRVVVSSHGVQIWERQVQGSDSQVTLVDHLGLGAIDFCYDIHLLGAHGEHSQSLRACGVEDVELPTNGPTTPPSVEPEESGSARPQRDRGCSTYPSGSWWLAFLLPAFSRLRRRED